MAQMGRTYAALDQIELADQFLDKALDQQTKKFGPKHPRVVENRLHYVRHQLAQKRLEKAKALLRELWDDFPTAAQRNLFPLEQAQRKNLIDLHVELFRANGEENELKEWKNKQ